MISHLIISYILGIISGVIATLLMEKKGVTAEKRISFLVAGLWLTMHTASYLTGDEVSKLFDVLGFGTIGHILGLNLGTILDKFKK